MSFETFPNKAFNDKKSYRVIKLENGLTALLISDPTPMDENDDVDYSSDEDVVYCTNNNVEIKKKKSQGQKMAAAALNVGVGSFHEPDDIPGLAHFLEHMVFMGSEKYPEENSFQAFITRRGGDSNACTDCEKTKFHFEVHKKYFYDTLDRFAQFFISPLLSKSSIDKEIEAVNNEFQAIIQADICKKDQLLGSLAVKGHPMGKFTWGNCDTLRTVPLANGIDVYSRLAEFRKKYYVSNVMHLAVQSQEELDTLEKWVKEIFSQIPSGFFETSFSNLDEPFNTPEFRKLYKIVSANSNTTLYLTWAFPPMHQYHKEDPIDYISHLIGHEGKGSLLSYLKTKVWALSLWADSCSYEFQENSTCNLFSFSVQLTDDGLEHLYDVLCGSFSYIAMLKHVGPIERIYKENKLINLASFQWADEAQPIDYVKYFSTCMKNYPVEDYISGDTFHYNYDKSFIEYCLNKLTPEDVNIMLVSDKYSTEDFTDREPWHQTLYQANEINPEWINQFKTIEPLPDFFLPLPNNFIATDFNIKDSDIHKNDVPIKILNTSQGSLWYKHDIKFNVPKAVIIFYLKSPLIQSSHLTCLLEDLFLMCLNQNVQEDVYPAHLADLEYGVDSNSNSLIIQVSGYNDKLEVLLETLVDHIVQFDVNDDLFEALKTDLGKRNYTAFLESSNLANIISGQILRRKYWCPIIKMKILKNITKDLVLQFAKDLIRRLFIECLCQGNISSEESIKLFKLVETKLKCGVVEPEEFKKNRIMKLPQKRTYCRVVGISKDDDSSLVDNYYQCGSSNMYSLCQLELLIEFMEEPCFNILRTQEQLGYSVYCLAMQISGIYGFCITVHSASGKFSCSEIDRKIEEFLNYFRNFLNNLTEDDFKIQVSSLISSIKTPDLELEEEVGRNIAEIVNGDYVFDRLEKKINCLQNITLKGFRDFFNVGKEECLHFNKLSVQIMAGSNAEQNEENISETAKTNDILTSKLKFMYMAIDDDDISQSEVIMDIESFKEKLEIFPLP